MQVVVGDMSTWHRAADPVLNSDLEALAATQGRVVTIGSSAAAAPKLAAAAADAARPSAAEGESIVTVVFPHDISWQPAAADGAGDGSAPGAAALNGAAPAAEVAGPAAGPGAAAADGDSEAAAALESEGAKEFICGCAKVSGGGCRVCCTAGA